MLKQELKHHSTSQNIKARAKTSTHKLKRQTRAETSKREPKHVKASWNIKAWVKALIHCIEEWFFMCHKTIQNIMVSIFRVWGVWLWNSITGKPIVEIFFMSIKKCLLVISNYGMSFMPGIVQAGTCQKFFNFLKEKMEKLVLSASLTKVILLSIINLFPN